MIKKVKAAPKMICDDTLNYKVQICFEQNVKRRALDAIIGMFFIFILCQLNRRYTNKLFFQKNRKTTMQCVASVKLKTILQLHAKHIALQILKIK